MSVLRNLEAKIGGLVEGAFGRAFKTNVQPVELAHKLAKEMEENQMVSVSRVYVPNFYRDLPLRAGPRAVQLAMSLRCARSSRTTCSSTRARSGWRSPAARRSSSTPTTACSSASSASRRSCWPSDEEEVEAAGAAPAPSAGDFGHTMVYSPDNAVRRLEPEGGVAASRQALLVGEGRRSVLSGARVVLGRSRDCDVVVSDPNVSRRHAELRRDEQGWSVADLGSTNGIKLNGRRVDHAPLREGDRITLGVTDLTFELD